MACLPREHRSIDETSLSNGELYAIVTNKAAHGREHSLVAIVLGTDSDYVPRVLRQIDSCQRNQVTEIALIKAFRAKLHDVNDTKFFIFRLCNLYA